MKINKKVLIAMSGGVDSSVVAAILKNKYSKVVGAFMINYDTAENGEQGTCYINDYRDAVRVAAKLNIELLKLDFKKEYKKNVLDYMYEEYKKGKTPNPDVMCNKYIKFGFWLEKAKELGFDYLATGHYAKIDKNKQEFFLEKAKDENKDQTYFLHQLNQDQLKYTLFPIGKYTKKQVRKLAKKFDLPTAEKEESMGICFVGEVDMKKFLTDKIKNKKGSIILENGEKIGEHDGLSFYTIGQRHGFEQIGGTKALFVLKKDFENNLLIVGEENSELLYKKEIELENIHFISEKEIKFPLKCDVRLRHRQKLQKAVLNKENNCFILKFNKKQKAITPGQFAVFYKGNYCLGGGAIK
ncbi:MAG: tRNA 2-thiouridine(34) synthase MnmA [Patescibacteria group bacterium]